MVERRDYGPWGLRLDERIKAEGSEAGEDYTGHELDIFAGLVYAGARYYIPAIGRWNATDPILGEELPLDLIEGDPRFLNQSPYNYVGGDPMRLRDNVGKQPCCPMVPNTGRTHLRRTLMAARGITGDTDAIRAQAAELKLMQELLVLPPVEWV